MEEKENKQENYNQLSQILDEMQKQENQGRGVSCVRTIVEYLKVGKIKEAITVADIDWDKIRNYPKIAEFLKMNLGIKD